jgi:hypothetical protein
MESSLQNKFAMLENLVRNPKGRSVIAASLQQPLRTQRDYASVGRKMYLVDPLPNGVLPVYDKDPEARAYVVGEEGDSVEVHVRGERVLFPLCEITAQPNIPMTEITSRRFSVIERTVAKHTSEIGYEEDRKAFATVDALCSDPASPNQDINCPGVLTSSALIDGFAAIEENDLRVAYIFCNAKDFADIRKWDRDVLDPVSQGELLKTGVRQQLWGANIVVSRCVPRGTVYLTCEPDFFGRIPIRYDLTIISADNAVQRTIGFSMFENLGFGAFNPKGAQRIKVIR